MKKIIIAVAVLATVACSAVIVTSATKDESAVAKPNYPTESSAYYTPTPVALSETETIKKQLKEDAINKYSQIYNELKSANNFEDGSLEQKELAWEAKEKIQLEFSYKTYDILEKYNKLEEGYTITDDIKDDYNIMSIMCEMLNDNDIRSSLTTEETAMLELYLEDGYYYIEGDGTEELKNSIEKLVELPYWATEQSN